MKAYQKTKTCPTCGKTVKKEKLEVLYKTNKVEDALAKVLSYKKPPSEPPFKRAVDVAGDKRL